jgi:hypothetical protein
VAVSDSRVSGGESWDRCPKLVPLPRPATAIAMSGNATAAYAFLLQAINTCHLLDGNQIGRTDIAYLARKLRDVYAESRREVSDLPVGQRKADTPVLDVVLFGWSWRRLQFEAYSYRYNTHGELVMRTVSDLDENRAYGVYFAGDASVAARKCLKEVLKEKDAPIPMRGAPDASEVARSANLDWEPVEVLQRLIKDNGVRTVGGIPQILKVSQYGATEMFVWRTDSDTDFFGGREVRKGERFDRRIARYIDGRVQFSVSDRSIMSAPEADGGDT